MEDTSNRYTLDEAISAIGFGNFQYFLLAYGGLGWVAEAMETMILSFIGPVLQSEWGLSSSEESMISTSVFIGMLLGSFLWGLVSDAYGRKKAFLGASLFSAVAGLCSAFSPNYVLLVIVRCVAGLGLGGGHIFVSWFLEFVPTPIRGTWMIVFSSFWTFGTIVEALLAWAVIPKYGWRWLLILSSLPSFVVLLLSGFIPESPRYLCTKGRIIEAQNMLYEGATQNGVIIPDSLLISHQITELANENISGSEDEYLLSSKREKKGSSWRRSSSFSILFSSKFTRTTLLLWFLYIGNTFSYYGIVLLTSELNNSRSKCRPPVLLPERIQDANLYIDVTVTSLAELPGLVLAAFIVDKVGRKVSMLILLLLGLLLLLPLVSLQNETMVMSLLFGARMFISATFIVCCIYAPEVYPTEARSTGVGIATAIGRIGGIICPVVAVALVNSCHQVAAVLMFAGVIALSSLSILFLPLETMGRDLIDSEHLPGGK